MRLDVIRLLLLTQLGPLLSSLRLNLLLLCFCEFTLDDRSDEPPDLVACPLDVLLDFLPEICILLMYGVGRYVR